VRSSRAALILLALLVGAFGAGVLLQHRRQATRRPRVTLPALTTNSATMPPPSLAAGGTARQRTPLQSTIDEFALAYASYLDGGSGKQLGLYGSITSTAQATDDGRIPVAFRDGRLRIASTSSFARTCCSAQETIVLANRAQSYPLTVDLLYEHNAWQVSELTPVDLSIDQHLPQPVAVKTPVAANTAARHFALAYTLYRAGETVLPDRLTPGAHQEITQGTDSLAGARLVKGGVRLVAIAYGPPSGNEFAATATVTDITTRHTFSFLMVHTPHGWMCGAFL